VQAARFRFRRAVLIVTAICPDIRRECIPESHAQASGKVILYKLPDGLRALRVRLSAIQRSQESFGHVLYICGRPFQAGMFRLDLCELLCQLLSDQFPAL
jgi:hypothetical protein